MYDYLTNGTDSYGAIVAADSIYIINSTDTCGVSGSYDGVTTVANAQSPLNATLSTLTLSANATDAVAVYSEGVQAGRADLASVDTESSGFHQEALVPLDSETHAGEDISLHARGPGSQFVRGVVEQNLVFHLINQALDLLASE